jgi:hypothetical protein
MSRVGNSHLPLKHEHQSVAINGTHVFLGLFKRKQGGIMNKRLAGLFNVPGCNTQQSQLLGSREILEISGSVHSIKGPGFLNRRGAMWYALVVLKDYLVLWTSKRG